MLKFFAQVYGNCIRDYTLTLIKISYLYEPKPYFHLRVNFLRSVGTQNVA